MGAGMALAEGVVPVLVDLAPQVPVQPDAFQPSELVFFKAFDQHYCG